MYPHARDPKKQAIPNKLTVKITENADVEIRVDTTVATSTKQSANRPDIVIHDKKRKEIIIVEVGITS